MRRIGLLGGSFNPAHRGHRHISLAARERLGLDEIWWLVSPQNPLKSETDMAPLAARLAAATAMARRSPIRAMTLESELGTRYSIDTARAVRRRFPRHRFIWMMGSDNLAQLHRWRDWRGLARTLPIAVLARPSYLRAARRARAMGWLKRFEHDEAYAKTWSDWTLPAITLLTLPLDTTSATHIRERDPDWARRYADPASPDQ